jgi:hypothetical protein
MTSFSCITGELFGAARGGGGGANVGAKGGKGEEMRAGHTKEGNGRFLQCHRQCGHSCSSCG